MDEFSEDLDDFSQAAEQDSLDVDQPSETEAAAISASEPKIICVNNMDEFIGKLDDFSQAAEQDSLDVDQLMQFLAVNNAYLERGICELALQDLSIYHFEPDLSEKFHTLYLKASEAKGEDETLKQLHRLSEVAQRPLGQLQGIPLANIMIHLSKQELGRAAQVSKKWQRATKLAKLFSINNNFELSLKQQGIQTIPDLFEFCQKNKELTCLNLREFEIDNDQLKELVGSYPHLKRLMINSKEIDDKGLEILKVLDNLEDLVLAGCEKITDKGLENLQRLVNLKMLCLTRCTQITDKGLENLQKLVNLKSLALISCTQITDKGLENLKQLVNLKSLELDGCNNITCIENLQGLVNLKILCLDDCNQITDKGLEILKELVKLEQLSLDGCNKITDVKGLKQLLNLEAINMGGCMQTTDQCLENLQGLVNLKVLLLGNCIQIMIRASKA